MPQVTFLYSYALFMSAFQLKRGFQIGVQTLLKGK